MNPFIQRLRDASNANGSLISIGLDPDPERMPVDLLDFNKEIIDATKDLVCTYKPNLAFYEALGMPGMEAGPFAQRRRILLPAWRGRIIGDELRAGSLSLWALAPPSATP